MPDNLKKLTDNRDRELARRHKLTGEVVIPERVGGKRFVCMKCRAPDPKPDDAEYLNWRACLKCGGTLIEMTL